MMRMARFELLKRACYLPTGSDNESNLGLAFDEEVAGFLGSALGVNDSLVASSVLSSVLLSIGGSGSSLGSTLLLGSLTSSLRVSENLGISSALFRDILRDNSCPKTSTNVMLASNRRFLERKQLRQEDKSATSSRPSLTQRSHRLGAAIRTFITNALK